MDSGVATIWHAAGTVAEAPGPREDKIWNCAVSVARAAVLSAASLRGVMGPRKSAVPQRFCRIKDRIQRVPDERNLPAGA